MCICFQRHCVSASRYEEAYIICYLHYVRNFTFSAIWQKNMCIYWCGQTTKKHIGYIKSRVIFCTIVTNNSYFGVLDLWAFAVFLRFTLSESKSIWNVEHFFTMLSHQHTHVCTRQLPSCHTSCSAKANMLSEDPQLSLGLKKDVFSQFDTWKRYPILRQTCCLNPI